MQISVADIRKKNKTKQQRDSDYDEIKQIIWLNQSMPPLDTVTNKHKILLKYWQRQSASPPIVQSYSPDGAHVYPHRKTPPVCTPTGYSISSDVFGRLTSVINRDTQTTTSPHLAVMQAMWAKMKTIYTA